MARRCALTSKGAQSGNNVSHSQRKSRRQFKVNLQNVTLRSEALGRDVNLRLAVSTLRSVDHNGGLDAYLTSTANDKLSDDAVTLKRRIKKALLAKQAA